MNSFERVQIAVAHKEPDRLPIFEYFINAFIASDIMGRHMYAGYGGSILAKGFAEWMSNGKVLNL
jgi:hypothetical protein